MSSVELKQCFSIPEKSVVSLIGSGGKTNLMNYLANSFRKERVLMSTTTKINVPGKELYDTFYQAGEEVEAGITLYGELFHLGKLKSPPMTELKRMIPQFDKVFLEADGSKKLPLKGWAEFEPVILEETTLTIGILPISVCGDKIDVSTVHRLPLFLSYGFEENQTVTPEVLAAIVQHPRGLFHKYNGKKVLVLSQVSDEKDMLLANQVVKNLSPDCLQQLDRIIASDVYRNEGYCIWKNQKNA